MSTDTIYICNRCKKEARVDRSRWLTLVFEAKSVDLCPDCKEKFYALMKRAPYKT